MEQVEGADASDLQHGIAVISRFAEAQCVQGRRCYSGEAGKGYQEQIGWMTEIMLKQTAKRAIRSAALAISLKYQECRVTSMCEVLDRKDLKPDHPYDEEEPEDITGSLMKLSELSLQDFLASEPDIYTDNDLKVRYR